MTMKDPSHGRGPFVRRSEMSGLVAEVLKGKSPPSGNSRDKDSGLVKNMTGATRGVFSVCKVGDALITPLNNDSDYRYGDLLFEAEEVDESGLDNICIVQEPMNTGNGLTRARFFGMTRARLVGPPGMTHASPQAAEYTLLAGSDGPCAIVFDPGSDDEEDEEAERIAIVKINGCERSCYFWLDYPGNVVLGGELATQARTGHPVQSVTAFEHDSDRDITLLFGADLMGIYAHRQIVKARVARSVDDEGYGEPGLQKFVVESHGVPGAIGEVVSVTDVGVATVRIFRGSESEADFIAPDNSLGFELETGLIVYLAYTRSLEGGREGNLTIISVSCPEE